MSEAYPNPFNPSTIIEFGIVSPEFTSLRIYDVVGREVATLVDENLQPGLYTRVWDGGTAAGGIYFCRLTAGKFTAVKKLILVR